jgi:hypothetical protein
MLDVRTRRACVWLAVLVMWASADALAQRPETLTIARVRPLAKEAEAEGKGDKNEIILSLDRKFRQRWGDFESFPVSLLRRDDLSILLSTPYMTYRRALAESLRIGESVTNIPWVPAAVVTVTPVQIGAPDITAILLERSGKRVAPIENHLRPMSFANGHDQTAVLHAGEVRFPMSAFAPDGPVTITATSAAGERFAFVVDAGLLRTLK